MSGKINAGPLLFLGIILIVKRRLQQLNAGFGSQIRAADANHNQRRTFPANFFSSIQNLLQQCRLHPQRPVHPASVGVLFVHQLAMNCRDCFLILRPVGQILLHPVIQLHHNAFTSSDPSKYSKLFSINATLFLSRIPHFILFLLQPFSFSLIFSTLSYSQRQYNSE